MTLNGAPLPVSGSPSVYETTVNPGFPLQDANTLTVHAILANGYHVTESRQFQYLPPKARARQVADPDDLIEGPLAPVSCVSEKFYERCSCPDESKCGIRSIMKEVRDAIVAILEGVTLAQLCERVRQLQGQHDNPLDYVI